MGTQSASLQLMTNSTGNGAAFVWPGGRGMFMAVSTNWGGGSVALQWRGPDGVTWLATPAISLTADSGTVFDLPPGEVRAVVNTATGVTASAVRIPQ